MLGIEAGDFVLCLCAVTGVVFDLLCLVALFSHKPRYFTGKFALALALFFNGGLCGVATFVETVRLFAQCIERFALRFNLLTQATNLGLALEHARRFFTRGASAMNETTAVNDLTTAGSDKEEVKVRIRFPEFDKLVETIGEIASRE